jgi:hypothetical protein
MQRAIEDAEGRRGDKRAVEVTEGRRGDRGP